LATISCIIPAFNEGTRIASVLAVAVLHPLLDEIIVVDDGSTDGTRVAVTQFKNVHLLVQKTNAGKSEAICVGIRASVSDYLLFLDADLIGLTINDITALMLPVLQGIADASISLRSDALLPWRIIGLDYLSGERFLHRQLLNKHLNVIEHLPGFGLESFINRILIRHKSRIKVVRWKNVGHTYKARKYGILRGIAGEARMIMNIIETISLSGTALQILAMLRQRV
jgi:glycosyltransferase involved in cell wall biosynthesis